jgi:hypothetical protein
MDHLLLMGETNHLDGLADQFEADICSEAITPLSQEVIESN